jgi:hypothetical protein
MADSIMDVMSRLGQLEAQAQQKKAYSNVSKKKVETVHFGDSNQHGSYQLIPLPNPVYGPTPYVLLNGVKQFKVKKQFGDKSYDYTRKILPLAAYDIIEAGSGRIVSSLTGEDIALHKEAEKLWNDLYRKMGGYKKQDERSKEETAMLLDSKRGVSTKNYTIFNAWVVNRYDGSNLRKVIKSNYGALIVVPSAAMIQSIKENIIQISQLQYGGGSDWLNNIYSTDTKSRMGSIMLNVTRQLGYKITVQHSVSNVPIDINLSEEENTVMSNNPVENFIGFSNIPEGESEKDPGQRKLFSKEYYQTMIDELKSLNAAFDSGYQNIPQAPAEPYRGPVQGSADPFLNPTQAPQQVVAQPNVITAQPQPQVAHVDPVSGQNAFQQNAFQGFGGASSFSNPFMQQSPEGSENGGLPF